MMTIDEPAAIVASNGKPVPFNDMFFAPMRESSHLLDYPVALRSRFLEDGYLHLRGVLDRDEVLALRAAYFSRFGAGFLKEGTTPTDGIYSGHVAADLPAHGMLGHPAHDFVRSALFADFADSPVLRQLAETLLGGDARMLPRQILRHFYRGSGRASRAHVDFDYMNHGSDQLVTMWIPIGDCPLASGGLVYLDGSHHLDRERIEPLRAVTDRPHDLRAISHDLEWTATQLGGRWRWADYTAGDVAVHSPHLVHASLDTTSDAMRLSADVRFQRVGSPVDARWTRPWSSDDGA
jgi:ectoine hydroxylase-related dioxygenase (phytanoyl-CoA dioxygenase family)